MSIATIEPAPPVVPTDDDLGKQLADLQRQIRALWLALQDAKRRRKIILDKVQHARRMARRMQAATSRGKRRVGERHIDFAVRALQEAGRPLRMSEILAYMDQVSHPLPIGESRFSSVSFALGSYPELVTRVDRGLWALCEWVDHD